MLNRASSRLAFAGAVVVVCAMGVARAESVREAWRVSGGAITINADFGQLSLSAANSTLELVSLNGVFRAFTSGAAGERGYDLAASPVGDLELHTPGGVYELQAADMFFDAGAATLQMQGELVPAGSDGQAVGTAVVQLTLAPTRFQPIPTGTGEDAPETACQGSSGPDVIVGDLNGVSNYTAASGIDALSLGTTSCNLGTVWLNWIDNTNQHPVIGGNLYKMYRVNNSYDRFEQIGMSWLKNGFFALSQFLCCANCSATDGTHLGVGCSDPYSSSRNGTQSNLGPRWQVNANLGAFTYPPANPSFSGATARRCEVALSDLELSSATVRYFGEGQYVTPDDAASRNNNNNASYRAITVSGTTSNYTFAFTGGSTTQREKSAIRAWQDTDPTVTEVNVQVASEGLFILGYKVTDLGGGQYHYEYAVYNMNSDRSGQSFSVPVPGGVNVTNIGFHGVVYRNGDGMSGNFSSTPWTATLAGNALTWTTQTYGQNTNANALRWGTTYNFRFDADSPPVAANATLFLFKPGSPTSMTIATQAPLGTPLVSIASANPPMTNPYVASQPFRDVLENTTAALAPEGIGDGVSAAQGAFNFGTISVTFSGTPVPAPAAGNIGVSCTDSAGNGAGDCPSAATASGSGAGPWLITLTAPIPVLECTTLTFAGTLPGEKVQYQSLPGDTNMNGGVTGQDVLTLVTALNDGSANLPLFLAVCNVNRAGSVTGQDVLRQVQLLNGTSATQIFNGSSVAPCP